MVLTVVTILCEIRWKTGASSSSYHDIHVGGEASTALSISEVRRMTNLSQHSVEEVIKVFQEYANEEGCLSKAAFTRAFEVSVPFFFIIVFFPAFCRRQCGFIWCGTRPRETVCL